MKGALSLARSGAVGLASRQEQSNGCSDLKRYNHAPTHAMCAAHRLAVMPISASRLASTSPGDQASRMFIIGVCKPHSRQFTSYTSAPTKQNRRCQFDMHRDGMDPRPRAGQIVRRLGFRSPVLPLARAQHCARTPADDRKQHARSLMRLPVPAFLVLRPTNFEATMARIAAMLCRRARLVPNQAPRGFAPGADFATLARGAEPVAVHRFETCGSEH